MNKEIKKVVEKRKALIGLFMNDIEGRGRVGGVFELSNCCGALRWNDTDICIECREHADFNDNSDELESIKIDNKKDTL